MTAACGRLSNGVMVYPVKEILGQPRSLEEQSAVQQQLVGGQSSVEQGGQEGEGTTSLLGRMRRFLVTKVASRFVTGERLLHRVQNRLEDTKSE